MTTLPRPLLSAALLPLLASPLALASELAFAPSEGLELTKSIAVIYDLELQDLVVEVDGQDLTEMIGEFEGNMQSETSIVLNDEYGASSEGRVVRLVRTFDTLSSSTDLSGAAGGDAGSTTTNVESELAGESVVFTWNDETAEYDVAYPEGREGDAELLEGLDADLDLTSLLPAREVAEGDSWEVDLNRLGWAVMPGGDLAWASDEEDASMEEMDLTEIQAIFEDSYDELAESLLAGTCTVTFKGVTEVDDQKIAQMSVTIEIDGVADLSGVLEDLMDVAGDLSGEDMPDISLDAADLTAEFEGEGTFEWNLTGGHVHSFDISGDLIIGMEFAVEVEADGMGGSVQAAVELAGSFSESISAE
jgi:hypothetical protein